MQAQRTLSERNKIGFSGANGADRMITDDSMIESMSKPMAVEPVVFTKAVGPGGRPGDLCFLICRHNFFNAEKLSDGSHYVSSH